MSKVGAISLSIPSVFQRAQEVGWLFVARLLVAVVSPLVNLWVVRYLRADLYGNFAVANGIVSLIIPVAGMGLSLTVVQYGSRRPDQMKIIRNYALRVGAVYALIAYVMICIVSLIPDYPVLVRQLTYVMAIECIFLGIGLVLTSQAQVFARYRLIAMVSLSAAAVRWALTIVLLSVQADVRALFGIPMVISNLIYVVGLCNTKSPSSIASLSPAIAVTVPSLLDVFKSSLAFGFGDLVYLAYFRSGVVILSWFCAARDVGFYHLPFMILNLIYLVPTVLLEVLNPRLFRWSRESPSQFEHYFTSISKLMLIFGLVCAVSLFISADSVITILYGEDFAPASLYLKILAWAIPLRCWVQCVASALAAADEVAAKNRRQPIAAVFNVLANLILVPIFGVPAAAWVAVGTELVLLALYVPLLYRRVLARSGLCQLKLPVLSAIPLTVLLGWVAGLSVLWLSMLAVGSSAIVVGLLARTHFFSVDEWATLISIDMVKPWTNIEVSK